MNIYVGNLSRSVTEEMLKQLFESFGSVKSIKLIKDKFTGAVRGFAFVEMDDATQAQEAINNLNGRDFEGRTLTVNEAHDREDRPRSPRPQGGSNGGGSRFGKPRRFNNDSSSSSNGGGWNPRSSNRY